jgi:hypothetical protein
MGRQAQLSNAAQDAQAALAITLLRDKIQELLTLHVVVKDLETKQYVLGNCGRAIAARNLSYRTEGDTR